jgi:methionine-rich copper-binding protein CopC
MKRLLLPAILVLSATAAVLPGRSTPRTMHLRLVRAEPAADTTVTAAPREVKLFFSEAPQIKVTTIRLVNASKQAITVGEAKADADGKIVLAPITGSVTAGTWTVIWRTMARDGHVVNGEYHFTVKPAP